MSTSRILLFGVAAITLLFAGSVVIIDGVSRRPAAMILAPVQALEPTPTVTVTAAEAPAEAAVVQPPPWIQARREGSSTTATAAKPVAGAKGRVATPAQQTRRAVAASVAF